MHPVWLSIKDKQVQAKFDETIRRQTYKLIKLAVIFHWVFMALNIPNNISKSFTEQAFYYVTLTS